METYESEVEKEVEKIEELALLTKQSSDPTTQKHDPVNAAELTDKLLEIMKQERTSSDDEDSNKMPSPQPAGQTLAEVKEIEFMLQTMEIGLKKVVSNISY